MKEKISIIGLTLLFLLSMTIVVYPIALADPPIDFQYELYGGWNLITIPVENNFMASTLAKNITGCISINRWDATENRYYGYIVRGPLEFDFQIEDGYGLFVEVESASTFTVSGERLSEVSIDFHQEYSLLGWYKSQSSTASEIMNSIAGCTQVKGWDPSTQKDIYYNGIVHLLVDYIKSE